MGIKYKKNITGKFLGLMWGLAGTLILPSAIIGQNNSLEQRVLAQEQTDICQEQSMEEISEGLFYREYPMPHKSIVGDSKLIVLKANPKFYELKSLMRSETKEMIPVESWVRKYGLVAAINGGMFMQDFKTHCGYSQNGAHINNPKLVKDSKYKSLFVFGPINPSLPYAKILDLESSNVNKLKREYRVISQNLRMIDSNGKNRNEQGNKKYSESALGVDKDGNILFFFCRSPYSPHDFNEAVLSLQPGIRGLVHCEGGPEASLSINAGRIHLDEFGSYETGFNENNHNFVEWPVPNVFGLVKRKAK